MQSHSGAVLSTQSASPGFPRSSRATSASNSHFLGVIYVALCSFLSQNNAFSVLASLLLCLWLVDYIKSGLMFIGFGSALNIETLVAAAERRETPIEVIVLSFLYTFLATAYILSPWFLCAFTLGCFFLVYEPH